MIFAVAPTVVEFHSLGDDNSLDANGRAAGSVCATAAVASVADT